MLQEGETKTSPPVMSVQVDDSKMASDEHQLVMQQQSTLSDTSGSRQTDSRCILLGELVGACQLKPDGDEELKPYCLFKFGDRLIHRSKEAADLGANPIWTIETRSLFLLKVSSKDLLRTKLTVSVWNRRRDALNFVADATFLGSVSIDLATVLLNCNEERFEVSLDDGDGKVALRFRMATQADREFVTARNHILEDPCAALPEVAQLVIRSRLNDEQMETGTRKLATPITEVDQAQIASTSFINAIAAAFQWSHFTEKETGIHMIRSKPFPDPARPQQTEFMTSTDIKMETMKASHNWVECGSGELGTLFLEILSCHDLPNVDTGEAVGNLTDAFVCAVFEDVMVQTPVIDDELSPHWLPWTQRAFRIGIMHPASVLYLGVFDYDLGLTDHEAIGRVAVNLSNYQRDTTYTLKFNLHKSSNVTDRSARGSLTIRLRYEILDEKAALLVALKPRPRIHVNVQKEKTFRVVRYTCFGEYDNEEKFDMTVFRSYINEIFEYKSDISYCLSDSIKSLIFWRGQVEILNLLMPLHSFVFFCAASTLVERPYMFPSFMLLTAAWTMLATNSRQRHHPSPWMRPHRFIHYLSILWTGKSTQPIKRIAAYENQEKTQAYEKAWAARLARDQQKRDEEFARLQEINNIGNDKIDTKTNGMLIPIDLLLRLARYQNIIGRLLRKIRFYKMVLTWEESNLSFWITAILLSAGLVSLLLPWAFVLTWTGRIVVYGLFGPHMKFVDVFLQAQGRKDGDVDKSLAKFREQTFLARLRREEAVKLKAVKEIRFGRYITEVPQYNLARHFDRPLPQSSARIYHREDSSDYPIDHGTKALWLPGQQLYGSMIPRPENVYRFNQEMVKKELKQLLWIEARMAALRAAEVSGGGLVRVARRVSMIRRSEEPRASGYELMCNDEHDEGQPVLGDLCVGPYQAESKDEQMNTAVDKQFCRRLSLSTESEEASSDHESTSDYSPEVSVPPSERCSSPVLDEEGVEVVAFGRLIKEDEGHKDTSLDGDEEIDVSVSFDHGEATIDMAKTAFEEEALSGTLSMLYQASDSTYLAFYRPPDAPAPRAALQTPMPGPTLSPTLEEPTTTTTKSASNDPPSPTGSPANEAPYDDPLNPDPSPSEDSSQPIAPIKSASEDPSSTGSPVSEYPPTPSHSEEPPHPAPPPSEDSTTSEDTPQPNLQQAASSSSEEKSPSLSQELSCQVATQPREEVVSV